MTPKADAVLLLAFGGPEAREEIRPFLEEALRGRGAPPERLEEVARHYEAIGGLSPIGALTRAQAAALEAELARRGRPLPVRVGMRNWRPFLADALGALADEGRRGVVVVVLAPHGGEASRGRYDAALAAAMRALGPRAPAVRVAAPFGGRAEFIDALAARVREALPRLPEPVRSHASWIFTAHSVPAASAGSAGYAAEIRRTGDLLAARFGNHAWRLAWQSRSGDPRSRWLEPDVSDVLRDEARCGARAALVAPIGFVSDHVEVLYDLDHAAAASAAAAGLVFARVGTPGTHPAFTALLADLVEEIA